MSADEAARLRRERDEYKREYEKADDQISKLKKTNTELAQLKDQQKAAAIIRKNSTQSKAFEELIRSTAKALGSLPRVVQEALFYDYRDEEFRPEYDKWENAPKDAEEHGFLKYNDEEGWFSVNGDNPKIGNAKSALDELRRFVGKAPSSFCEAYDHEYEELLDFRSRDRR